VADDENQEKEQKADIPEGEEEAKESDELNVNAPTKESLKEIKRLERRIG
jgi:hypothetical protein